MGMHVERRLKLELKRIARMKMLKSSFKYSLGCVPHVCASFGMPFAKIYKLFGFFEDPQEYRRMPEIAQEDGQRKGNHFARIANK